MKKLITTILFTTILAVIFLLFVKFTPDTVSLVNNNKFPVRFPINLTTDIKQIPLYRSIYPYTDITTGSLYDKKYIAKKNTVFNYYNTFDGQLSYISSTEFFSMSGAKYIAIMKTDRIISNTIKLTLDKILIHPKQENHNIVYFEIPDSIKNFSEVIVSFSSTHTSSLKTSSSNNNNTTHNKSKIPDNDINNFSTYIEAITIIPDPTLKFDSLNITSLISDINLHIPFLNVIVDNRNLKFNDMTYDKNTDQFTLAGVFPSIEKPDLRNILLNKINIYKFLLLIIILLTGVFIYTAWDIFIDIFKPLKGTINIFQDEVYFLNNNAKHSKMIEVLLVVLVLLLFTAVKFPTMGLSFGSKHLAVKFNSYINPAQVMAEINDPFYIEKRYASNPVSSSYGKVETPGYYPILEWWIALFIKVLPFLSLEYSTRIALHILGALFLFLIYRYLRCYTTKTISLMTILLLSFNVIIQYATWIPVYDLVTMIFMLISLIIVEKYFISFSYMHLIASAVILGFGISCKISMGLWALPIFLTLFLIKKRSNGDFLVSSFIFFMSSGLIYLISKKSAAILVRSPTLSIIILITSVIVIFLIGLLLDKKNHIIINFTNRISKIKYFPIAVGVLYVLFATAIIISLYSRYKIFLTDIKFLTNPYYLIYLIFVRFTNYSSNVVFVLAIISIVTFYNSISKSGSFKTLLISLTAGVVIYVLTAFTSIFIHSYYTLIIILLLTLCGSLILTYSLINFIDSVYVTLPILLILFAFIGNINTSKFYSYAQYDGVRESIDFVKENIKNDEYYLAIGNSYCFSIYHKCGSVYNVTAFLENKQVAKMVSEFGFSEAMKRLKVKYIISTHKTLDYPAFSNMFSDTPLQRVYGSRMDQIDEELFGKTQFYNDMTEREQLLIINDVYKDIQLEQKIGDFRFYKLY